MFDEEQIETRVNELAQQIANDYKDQELVLIGVLHGGAALLTDLSRALWKAGMTTNVYKDYLGISSYEGSTESNREPKFSKNLKNSIKGRNALIVEDIVDTGHSLLAVYNALQKLQPNSIKALALLSKPSRREVEVEIDYLGWEIPNEFVVGYDLDYDEMYRTMPYIGKVIFD